jgi:hypothetical protein
MKIKKKTHTTRRIFAALTAGFVMMSASAVSAQPITNHHGQNHQEGHEDHEGHEGHKGHRMYQMNQKSMMKNQAN